MLCHRMIGDWVEKETYDRKLGPFRIIKVSLSKLAIDEDGIRNTVSTDRATLVATAKSAQHKTEFAPNEPVEKRTTASTQGKDRQCNMKPLTRCKNTLLTTLWAVMVKVITLGMSYDGMAGTCRRFSTAPALLATGAECRRMTQWDKEVDEHTSKYEGRCRSSRHLLDGSHVDDEISNTRQW